MARKGIKFETDSKTRNELLEKWMFIKSDKPSSCYSYINFLSNLKTMKAEELAIELNCAPTDLNCATAYDLLYVASTRFKSIHGYREYLT